ncbi:MAG: Asp-tRNA(Asn)/Glu-tRNA(Gln) amidotransferase subunit GatB, partial [Planctomycetota bacterium]|nr:Asp-tRNA(Asn)/Glu-tRNA(Gln) amidotransferase subunit GatB [Planctomycetota bacterium]
MSTVQYDVIIGLEVHTQLKTQSKLFCGCSTTFRPNDPNTQTCPVCLGLPGSLPVMNRRAFELSLTTALALNCEIAPSTRWDRKQYYYPDLPKAYQISQFDLPFSSKGWLDIAADDATQPPRRIRITRAHLEEDAGKNVHDDSVRGAESRVDLNRTGTPLLEIVSEPDLRSASEARRYLENLRSLLLFLEVSDCNMQEGSLRCDANVNLHVHNADGSRTATPIVELKNMNSFRNVELAVEYEVRRQA